MASMPSTSSETIMEKMETEEKLNTGYGYAVIFNHETFDSKLNQQERKGTENDVIKLKKVFKQFNIKVHEHKDLTLNRIKEEVQRLSNFNFTPYECLIIVILSHGKENNFLWAHDFEYNLNKTIINPIVKGNASLKGMPKIFIIQACKGSQVTEIYDSNEEAAVTIPKISDMYFAFSTFEGYLSKRHPKTGGIFIQTFCEMLIEDGLTKSISTIMEQVTAKLIAENENQVPMVQSTMSKPFIFGDIGREMPKETENDDSKGYAVIFNHETFDQSINQREREGTEIDVTELKKVFEKFYIEVHVNKDLTLNRIKEEVKILSNFNFTPYECLIIVILSQGKENNILYAHDWYYNLNDTIVNPIVNTNPSLEGKPKIFIIQACKGSMNPKSLIQFDGGCGSQPSFPALPISDMFFAFSTFEGFVSQRYVSTGGIFIQKFCDLLMKYGLTRSISTIMERVTHELLKENKKQVPMVLTTMSKPFMFGNTRRGMKKKIEYIKILPDEMIVKIFSYLSLADLKDASKVCKKWNKAFNHPKTLNKFTLVLNDKNFDEFLGNFDRINFLSFYRCEITEYQLLSNLHNTKNLKILKISDCKWKLENNKSNNNWNLVNLKNIKHFEFRELNQNNSNCFYELLKIMPCLEILLVFKDIDYQIPNNSLQNSNFLYEYIQKRAFSLISIELKGFMLNSIEDIVKINYMKLEKLIIHHKLQQVILNRNVECQPLIAINENSILIRICNNLKNLKFLSIDSESEINDSGIKDLWKLKQLKTLFFFSCQKMTTGGFINGIETNDNLQSLTLLNLRSCGNLLMQITNLFQNLRELILGYDLRITEKEIQNVWRFLRSLKKLVIHCDEVAVTDFAYTGKSIENESDINGCSIADVEGLEHLELSFKSNITFSSLQEIVKLKGLVYLCADFSCSKIKINDLDILRSCKSLETIDIKLSREKIISNDEEKSLKDQLHRIKSFRINQ